MGAVVKINFQPVADRLRNAASVVLLGNREVPPVGKHRALGFVFTLGGKPEKANEAWITESPTQPK